MYILIYSQVCAAFALDAHALNEDFNNTYVFIVPGLTERGYLETDEMATYLLELQKN